MQRLVTVLLVMCGFAASHATAGEPVAVLSLEEGQASPAATIDRLAWLEGHWAGEGLGGTVEEILAPAQDGQMPGMFRYAKDGKIGFYEFYVFTEEEGSLALKLKHFSRALKGWEEKDDYITFRLVRLEDRAAYFDGLTYALDEEGVLRAAVQTGPDKIARFRFEKVTD